MCLLQRSILKTLTRAKTRAAVGKAHKSDLQVQTIRHFDLIPFEKFLYSVAVKCCSPV